MVLLACCAPGWGAVFNLRADATTLTLPGGARVGMWGFALDSAFGAGDGRTTIPGPTLSVPPGDGVLTIRLKNNLTQAKTGIPEGVPVSLIVPALPGKLTPVYWGPTPYPQFSGRVRSLNAETPPGNTAPVEYTWTGVRPGTFLYHSATQMQVQVQMGLYGAVKKDFTQGQAYPGVAYDRESLLFYSEIDPALHQAVVSGNYGPGKPVTSTMGYHPRWFLVNGAPFSAAKPTLHAAPRGRRLLLRMINAGLETHVPTLNGLTWNLVAEDGNPYPNPRVQYTASLAAGKTLDAVITPDAAGRFPIFDHALALANNLQRPGGLLSYVDVTAVSAAKPTAKPNVYATSESRTLIVPARVGVLYNDVNPAPGTSLVARLVSGPANGKLTLNGDGSFTYTPNPLFYGLDKFTYLCSNGLADSAPSYASINVTFVNHPPVTRPKHFTTKRDTLISIMPPGILAGDYDPEGKPLTGILIDKPATGTINSFYPDGSMAYMPPPGWLGEVTFHYMASDGAANSTPTTVTLKTAVDDGAPVPAPDAYTMARNTTLAVTGRGVLANDTDPDGDTLMAFISSPPGSGTLQLDTQGAFQYTPGAEFTGKASFEYLAYDGQKAVRATVSLTIGP